MEGGYVLNFSDRTMDKFFRDEIGIDIKSQKYSDAGRSKANRLKSFWLKEDNRTVGEAILKLIEYIESQILIAKLQKKDFPIERINSSKQIAQRLLELGRVDELFDHNPCRNEMNKCQKGLAQFLIPRRNTAKLFELIEEPFHLLA